jgi:hypothetical protein
LDDVVDGAFELEQPDPKPGTSYCRVGMELTSDAGSQP